MSCICGKKYDHEITVKAELRIMKFCLILIVDFVVGIWVLISPQWSMPCWYLGSEPLEIPQAVLWYFIFTALWHELFELWVCRYVIHRVSNLRVDWFPCTVLAGCPPQHKECWRFTGGFPCNYSVSYFTADQQLPNFCFSACVMPFKSTSVCTANCFCRIEFLAQHFVSSKEWGLLTWMLP